MKIHVTLMGILRDRKIPEDVMEFGDGMTIQDVIVALDIPADSVHACTVNGILVRDRTHELSHGDELTLVPPVGGG